MAIFFCFSFLILFFVLYLKLFVYLGFLTGSYGNLFFYDFLMVLHFDVHELNVSVLLSFIPILNSSLDVFILVSLGLSRFLH